MIHTPIPQPITGIYKIISPSSRIYIGQSVNIINRWIKYKRLDCEEQPKLYRSLKKYGPENHKFEIIEECLIEMLDKREIYWGQVFNTINEGLNLRLGSGKGACSEETRMRMSKSGLGKKRSQETKDKMSKSHKGNQNKLGSKLTQETKDKISSQSTPIICIETNKIFKNIRCASEEMSISHTFIWRVCKNTRKQAKGYTFKFIP